MDKPQGAGATRLRIGEVPTEGQEGERFPQGHHKSRGPLREHTGLRVEERQGRGFEEGIKFGRIQQAMEGHQHGPRRVTIERHARLTPA